MATPITKEAEDSAKNTLGFRNVSETGEIPSFNGDEKAKAMDFSNYFCSYAQLYHQKQMLADHNRMAAYHAAIMGNQELFRDKVVMDIGAGSGILAVWAAQAGARRVYAIEYTDMAHHARAVMKANQVDHIVKVIQCAVEGFQLPEEEEKDLLVPEEDDEKTDSERVIDIMVSEWMGYFLLRESMLDSVLRARDRFLKPRTGLLFPSHAHMFVAPISDDEERRKGQNEYAAAMSDFDEFAKTTLQIYGVDMSILEPSFEREQKEYFLLSSRWTELPPEAILAEPKLIKELDLMSCTMEDARGISFRDEEASFAFDVNGNHGLGPISGIAGWFSVDFQSRTDAGGRDAPIVLHPAHLSTGPDNGYTHWGQQSFYFLNSIPILKGETTRLTGEIEMRRTKENSRLYNVRIVYNSSRRRCDDPADGPLLMKSGKIDQVYQIP